MRISSDDFYTGETYAKNKPAWNAEDSVLKAGWVYDLYTKNNIVPRDIIEVGCGAGGILEELSKKDLRVDHLKGFDISPWAINLARPKETERLKFFNKNFTADDPGCDLLLVIDVIEHVDDFYGFLRNLTGKAEYIVFHIPLDLSCRTILKPHILLGHRRSAGHIHYFTEEMVLWILQDIGCGIIDRHYTKPIIDLNPAKGLQQGLKKILRNFSYRLSPSLSAKLWGGYSLMILAKPV